MNEAQTAAVIQRWNILLAQLVIRMSGRGKWRPRRTLTNDDECLSLLFFLFFFKNPYLALLSPPDQQGVGSGGFSGGERSVSPGSVALGALHCVWDHHVHLCHRRVDLLPVWKTTIKARILCHTYTHTHTHTYTDLSHISCQHITCKCKIITVFVLSALTSYLLHWDTGTVENGQCCCVDRYHV